VGLVREKPSGKRVRRPANRSRTQDMLSQRDVTDEKPDESCQGGVEKGRGSVMRLSRVENETVTFERVSSDPGYDHPVIEVPPGKPYETDQRDDESNGKVKTAANVCLLFSHASNLGPKYVQLKSAFATVRASVKSCLAQATRRIYS
jgi:hypothetical protein